jgi:tetratricopeptide (TPR) repeat protein
MDEVTIESLPKASRDFFNRGFTALERGNTDYAIDMLGACVEASPRFVRAWKFLRAAELKRARKKKDSSLTKGIKSASQMPMYLSAVGLLKSGKNQAAMMTAEKLLRNNPENPKYAKVFAEAAVAFNLPEVALLTLEGARDANPDDVDVLSWLGALYQKTGRMRSARECFERLCEISPNDPGALKQLKDAMALDSMASDGWEQNADKGGSFRDMLKDSEEAALLEQGAKSAKSDSGLDSLIADMKQKIEGEPNNINYRRGLANMYLQKREFETAITVLEEAVALNPGDPELERTLSNARIRHFESMIETKKNEGDENGAIELENQLLQFKFDDLQSKVERYPNDLQLRFEWGVMLYENDYFNEAIQQFQLAQRSAKNRVQALYYMGICFRAKKQYDIASRQLESALADLPVMDGNKKKVLYELGELANLTGDSQKASDYFMQIYQSDIAYKDVAAKIEASYAQISDAE